LNHTTWNRLEYAESGQGKEVGEEKLWRKRKWHREEGTYPFRLPRIRGYDHSQDIIDVPQFSALQIRVSVQSRSQYEGMGLGEESRDIEWRDGHSALT
jgi:hypothetical protein